MYVWRYTVEPAAGGMGKNTLDMGNFWGVLKPVFPTLLSLDSVC